MKQSGQKFTKARSDPSNRRGYTCSLSVHLGALVNTARQPQSCLKPAVTPSHRDSPTPACASKATAYICNWLRAKQGSCAQERGAGGRGNFLPKATGLMAIFTTTALIYWEPTKCQALVSRGSFWSPVATLLDLNQVSFPRHTHGDPVWTVEAGVAGHFLDIRTGILCVQ